MRGEKQYTGARYVPLVGSPPHARGKDFHISTSLPPYRITPACAGKSFRKYFPCQLSEDHPRMRGEKCIRSDKFPHRPGSPPHARGKVKCAEAHVGGNRITPACAGKRQKSVVTKPDVQDHPRMRGEKHQSNSEGAGNRGSPPHARGKGMAARFKFKPQRITPACAGKSTSKNLPLSNC